VLRIVADLGNSRLKWGRLGTVAGDSLSLSLSLVETLALPLDDPGAWAAAWQRWNPGGGVASAWAIASVNPPLAARLDTFLKGQGAGTGASGTTWYRSAAEVPVRNDLEHAATAGADRALAVAAATALHPPGRPGLVVSCGTAITLERIAADGTWQGGAIAPGLGLSARALHQLTAQLPLVSFSFSPSPREAPPAWGRSTRPALEAGVFWGTVGAVRELIARQSAELTHTPWLVWTGGDAEALAPWIARDWDDVRIVPDLVLEGLARVGFGP
jgi:type III pantothenate kinase